VHALTPDAIARARRMTLPAARAPRGSPLVPESALVLAARLSRVLRPVSKIVVIDGSPALVDALVQSGHDVTNLVEAVAPDAFDAIPGAPRTFTSTDEVKDDLLGCADLVVVDAFRREGILVPLLCRAFALTKPGGLVSLLAHALSRDLVKTTLALLPMTEIARDDEIAARLIAGCHLADIFWDHALLARTDGDLPVAPRRALTIRELFDHDPESDRHGCVEVASLSRPVSPRALDLVFARYAEMTGLTVVGLTAHASGARQHAHVVWSDGATFVALIDEERGVFRADMTGWTPSLHVDLAAAVVETLARDDATIVFSDGTPAPVNTRAE
jgi:hypothetical protein